ncbi:hypothetical protein [Azospirillum halopraeferens]|uniref:hypothetical protein n=1 Tax=Azospirillum halopraeferens TaxID=34010 RepID=UPI0004219CF2|nr:hypothetical protein [Azospirillum halopraeferens]
MTLLRILGLAAGVAAMVAVSAPARADGFSFRYDWSDGRGRGGPPPHFGFDHRSRHLYGPPPVVRDRYGRPLGYLVPGPHGPMVLDRPRRHGPPPPPPRGWGWGPPRPW